MKTDELLENLPGRVFAGLGMVGPIPVEDLESRACQRCRHYGEQHAPECSVLGWIVSDWHPAIRWHRGRLRCLAWEGEPTAKHTDGQMVMLDETTAEPLDVPKRTRLCPHCRRVVRSGLVHPGCATRAARSDALRGWTPPKCDECGDVLPPDGECRASGCRENDNEKGDA